MSTPPPSSARRLVFLDLLRLLAIFQMLQGHTVDAVLESSLRSGAVHAAWTSVRGLTSVAFLFVAGFSTALMLFGDYARQRTEPHRVRGRVRRALGLVALGYLLHLPVAALLDGQPEAALRGGAVVDILQCIGVTLLLLELALRLCPSPRALLAVAACGALASLGGAALASQLADALPPVLAGYVGPVQASLFPLWPWSAHLWLGVLAGGVLRPAQPGLPRRLALAAAWLAALGWAGGLAGLGAAAVEHLGRAACVVAVAAALSGLAGDWPRLPAPVQQVASSSLRIYVAHVVIVYADGVGLSTLLGPTLGLPSALAVTAAIMAASVAVALMPAPNRWVVARVPRTG